MTAAALTVESALKTPLATPTLADTPEVVTGGTQGATPQISTPSLSGQAMASVGDVTNCRSGPGTNYERITQILPADQVPIIGFFPPNYWIVNTNLGQCWLSGEFTTPATARDLQIYRSPGMIRRIMKQATAFCETANLQRNCPPTRQLLQRPSRSIRARA